MDTPSLPRTRLFILELIDAFNWWLIAGLFLYGDGNIVWNVWVWKLDLIVKAAIGHFLFFASHVDRQKPETTPKQMNV